MNYFNYTDEAIKRMNYSPGIVIEILRNVAKSLNLTYEYIYEEIDWISYQTYGKDIFRSKVKLSNLSIEFFWLFSEH